MKRQKVNIIVHLGTRAFEEIGGEVMQSVAFVLEKDGVVRKRQIDEL